MTVIRDVVPLGFPWKTQDPFLFCVHHLDRYPHGNEFGGPAASLAGRSIGQDFSPANKWRMYHGRRVPGFPAHPHYGFETVTIVTEGVVDHSDSLGAAGRFGFGDVQWMTAGKGVQHSEMFPLLHKDRDNTLELFQIWLNLPGSRKEVAPFFAMLWNESIPVFTVSGKNGRSTRVRIVAGQIGDVRAPDPAPDSWAADERNEVAIWIITAEPGAEWELPPAGPGVNRSLFYYLGEEADIDGRPFSSGRAFELVADHALLLKNGKSESRFLLLQGKPIGEPVFQQGPFVVNEPGQIQHVMSRYRQNQFGGWPWPGFEHVHALDRERFARYPDGREETRPL